MLGSDRAIASASKPIAGEEQLTTAAVASTPATAAPVPAVPTSPESFLREEKPSDEKSTDKALSPKSKIAAQIVAYDAQIDADRKLQAEAKKKSNSARPVPRRFTFSDDDIRRSSARPIRYASPMSIKTLLVNPGASLTLEARAALNKRLIEADVSSRTFIHAKRRTQPQKQASALATVASFGSSVISYVTSFVTAVDKEKETEAARATAMMPRLSASMPIPSSAQSQQQTLPPPARAPSHCWPGPPSYPQILQIHALTSSGSVLTDLPHALDVMGGYVPHIVKQLVKIQVDLPTLPLQEGGYLKINLFDALKLVENKSYNFIRGELLERWGVKPSTAVNPTAATSKIAAAPAPVLSASLPASSASCPQPPQIIKIKVLTESGEIETDLISALKLMEVYDPVKLMSEYHPDITKQIEKIRVDLPTLCLHRKTINTTLLYALQYMDNHGYDSKIRQDLYQRWGIIPSTAATSKIAAAPAPVLSASLPASSAAYTLPSAFAPVPFLPPVCSGIQITVPTASGTKSALVIPLPAIMVPPAVESKSAPKSVSLPGFSVPKEGVLQTVAQPSNPSSLISSTSVTTKNPVAYFNQDLQVATQPPAKENSEKQKLTRNGWKKAKRRQRKRENAAKAQVSSASAVLQSDAGFEPKLSSKGFFGIKHRKNYGSGKGNASFEYASLPTPRLD